MRRIRLSPRAGTLAAVLAGLLGSGAMMLGASYAAFNGSTSNGTNHWSAGTVTLADDDSGAAMFTTAVPSTGQVSAAAMKPGQSVVDCIKVSYTGTLDAAVHLYATGVTDHVGVSTGMTNFLHVKIEEGTGSSFAAATPCAGFGSGTVVWDTGTHPNAPSDLLADFPGDYLTGPVSPTTTWSTGTEKVYRFTVTLDPAVPDSSQGSSADATFVWQTRNS